MGKKKDRIDLMAAAVGKIRDFLIITIQT